MKNHKPLNLDTAPDFTQDAIDLLKKISETENEQEKLYEIIKKLSEYYLKGKWHDLHSKETH
jgi:hypothetical protein